tara:strand:- start:40 stop:327 length:288 start_codon:yes stop_codon:yes gene_type:complete
MSESQDLIEIEKMSIDQFAGSVVLILGAIGSLLLVVWQSRCACRCRIGCSDKCYLFDCERAPPPVNQEENNENEEENNETDNRNENNEDQEQIIP